ncbi:hypothetical protein sync_2231 [Synechococcus sp. CC9311]|nr:hypothetical protein sync_2231 [Synechococcus sp. CC9311]
MGGEYIAPSNKILDGTIFSMMLAFLGREREPFKATY